MLLCWQWYFCWLWRSQWWFGFCFYLKSWQNHFRFQFLELKLLVLAAFHPMCSSLHTSEQYYWELEFKQGWPSSLDHAICLLHTQTQLFFHYVAPHAQQSSITESLSATSEYRGPQHTAAVAKIRWSNYFLSLSSIVFSAQRSSIPESSSATSEYRGPQHTLAVYESCLLWLYSLWAYKFLKLHLFVWFLLSDSS